MSSLGEKKLWNVKSLQSFCKKKGMKIKGSKEELIARVFITMEQDLPDVMDTEQQMKEKAVIYQNLLCTPSSGKQPDPYHLTTGWVGEKVGTGYWPPTMYGDICGYFHSLNGHINKGNYII
ncbi:hypothetical protein SNE40_013034 [Patella caerulea]|uniref:SAP domain-containing protein n=1 Tax=Patella caerulea TaxID=87958 RepID=A0AAN8JK45_PATCE